MICCLLSCDEFFFIFGITRVWLCLFDGWVGVFCFGFTDLLCVGLVGWVLGLFAGYV